MVDRAIKVSVLEGDFASLSTVGFPLSLCIQLQLSQLKLKEAMWTAKYTNGGFSVNFFWPTSAPEKVNVQSKKKRKRKRKSKAKTIIVPSSSSLTSQQPAAVIVESQFTEKSDDLIPIDAQHGSPSVQKTSSLIRSVDESESLSHCSSSHPGSPSHKTILNLETCTEVQYESRDGVHGVSYHVAEEGEQGWTPVVGKRKKRGHVPCFVRRRFPSDHQIQDNPSSDSGSSSDLDLDDVIPSRVADVQYKVVDGKPGLSVSTRKTYAWTPIAARTRARMGNVT